MNNVVRISESNHVAYVALSVVNAYFSMLQEEAQLLVSIQQLHAVARDAPVINKHRLTRIKQLEENHKLLRERMLTQLHDAGNILKDAIRISAEPPTTD